MEFSGALAFWQTVQSQATTRLRRVPRRQDYGEETRPQRILDPLGCRVEQRMEGPDHWIIYAVVEQGNVADAEASTAVHHRKVGNHY